MSDAAKAAITNIFVLMLENHSFDQMLGRSGLPGLKVAPADASNSYDGKTYPLTGPVELTPPEIAETVGTALGKTVRYETITGEQWVLEVAGQDIPFLTQHIKAIAEMHRDGLMAGTSDFVERITGRAPMTLAEFVDKHRAVWL